MTITHSTDFESRLGELRPWLVLLARLHLDMRFREQNASDIAQEALVDAVKYRDRIENLEQSGMENWLRKVVRNKVIDFYRRKRVEISEVDLQRIEVDVCDSFMRLENLVADDASSPSQHAAKREDQYRLAEAMEQLPDDYREVVVMRDLSGWPLNQIAEYCDCTVGVVAGRLRRARGRLLELLETKEA